VKQLRTVRGPEGKLLFDWCWSCIEELDRRVLAGGLAEVLPLIDRPAPILLEPSKAEHAPDYSRTVALRIVASLLTCWGLVLVVAGCIQFTHIAIFGTGGAFLVASGACLAMISVQTSERKRVAFILEIVALGLAVVGLISGIVFHNAKRAAWIVALICCDALLIWGLRKWAAADRPKPDWE
jgi:hypothetical protein